MKKYFILLFLVSIVFSMVSCGGGSGSSSSPPGENPDVPFLIELRPSQYISQTNGFIYIHARVLNGNGNPIQNIPVTFTNNSPIGIFDVNPPVVNTDQYGYATVKLSSITAGFSTLQAEVSGGVSNLRDRTLVYFSDFALMWPQPRIEIEIDANGDGTYNDPSDFNFFETPTDDTALLRATAFDEFGERVVGIDITFSGDTGSSFPLGNVFKTNSNGQAFATLKVSPTSVVGQETSLNLQASGYISGSSETVGFLQVFLQPVSIAGIALFANPTEVVGSTGETSTVTAYITTSAGTIPDDLAVQFSVSPVTAGYVEPLVALTDKSAASTVFTPSATYLGDATVTGTIGSLSGETTVTVTAAPTALSISPNSMTVVSQGTAQPFNFTISGGTPDYTTSSSDPSKAYDSAFGDGIWNGASITVNIPANVCPGTVTLYVSDSVGGTASATITIIAPPLLIVPSSATICENDNTCSAGTDNADFTISGGNGSYSITSGNTSVISNPAGNPFTVNAIDDSITANTNVVITVTDGCGSTKTATVSVIDQP